MASTIAVNKAQITLTDPEFRQSKNAILLAVGRCKDGALIARNGETITFFPRVGPDKRKRMRKVLDSIGGPPKFKIGHLEVHLGLQLGTFEYTINSDILKPYLECYDLRAELYVTYVHCDATIGAGKSKTVFSIDFPVGAFIRVTGKPVCCPEKPELFAEIGDKHAPPEDAEDTAAGEMYEGAKKKDEERARRLEEFFKKGLDWKFDLGRDYKLNPGWGFDSNYGKDKKGKDKPIIKIKPKFGF